MDYRCRYCKNRECCGKHIPPTKCKFEADSNVYEFEKEETLLRLAQMLEKVKGGAE